MGRLARCDENTGQHQREADDVKQLRVLAEKDDRHRRSDTGTTSKNGAARLAPINCTPRLKY
jgi:hypothetical protein